MASLPSLKSLTPLLKTFRQPTWLAVFASAGIHGALFATSPSFSSSGLISLANPGEFTWPHTVPLVELTPEEQGRLPTFSDQSLSLFPDLNQDDLFNLPTTSPPSISDPFSSDLSSGGLTQDWLAQSPFQRQTTQILPPPSVIPLEIPFTGALPPFPPLDQNPNSLTPDNSSDPSTSELTVGETAPSVDESPPESPKQATGSTPNNQLQPPLSVPPRRLTELRPDEINQIELDLESWQVYGRTQVSLGPGPRESGNGLESESPNEGTQLSFNLPGSESLEARLEAYAYNAALTSEEAVSEALNAWTAEIQTQSEIEDLQPTLVEFPSIENPVRVCLPQVPASAMIGLLINPEGRIVDHPRLLKSTGYGALNNWAAQSLWRFLENQDLSQIDSYQALSYEIPINYDAESCLDRTRLIQSHG